MTAARRVAWGAVLVAALCAVWLGGRFLRRPEPWTPMWPKHVEGDGETGGTSPGRDAPAEAAGELREDVDSSKAAATREERSAGGETEPGAVSLDVLVHEQGSGRPVVGVPVCAVSAFRVEDGSAAFVVSAGGSVETDALGRARVSCRRPLEDERRLSLYVGLSKPPPHGSIPLEEWRLFGGVAFRWLERELGPSRGAGVVRLEVRRTFRIAGRVVDALERPVAGARFRQVVVAARGGEEHWNGIASDARSGPDGRFVLEPLVPVDGIARVLVRVGHDDWLEGVERSVEGPFEGTVDVGDVQLLGSRSFVVTGRLVRSDASPASGAPLVLVTRDGETHETESGRDGSFRIGGLRCGDGILYAPEGCLDGRPTRRITWSGGVSTHDLGNIVLS